MLAWHATECKASKHAAGSWLTCRATRVHYHLYNPDPESCLLNFKCVLESLSQRLPSPTSTDTSQSPAKSHARRYRSKVRFIHLFDHISAQVKHSSCSALRSLCKARRPPPRASREHYRARSAHLAPVRAGAAGAPSSSSRLRCPHCCQPGAQSMGIAEPAVGELSVGPHHRLLASASAVPRARF